MSTLPPTYTEVVVTSRGGGARQLRVGERAAARHRVMLRVVSDRLDNARRMRALIEQRFTPTPVAFGDDPRHWLGILRRRSTRMRAHGLA